MVHWTPLDEVAVFSGLEGGDAEQPLVEVCQNGLTMLVHPLGDGTGRLEKLVSPKPADFCNPKLQPGSIVILTGL
ncbi:MAG: hypothetical protein OWQ59_11870 [Alicyclobacillaceae bacterium]|uniref:YlzJ-like family protein n=1 Tax=Alicyclobacillus sp. SP_1 TaxID=2942475 RepID=UPI002157B8C2|nr:YlzJ-like family protein [Alicyclobacillus sp. SP_1]MCY0889137.1 hypothetical protein [Alicyclobacillaceae bacterium]MCY0896931.1 hypothetical protein [Alicyclobacillaceae bacterium]